MSRPTCCLKVIWWKYGMMFPCTCEFSNRVDWHCWVYVFVFHFGTHIPSHHVSMFCSVCYLFFSQHVETVLQWVVECQMLAFLNKKTPMEMMDPFSKNWLPMGFIQQLYGQLPSDFPDLTWNRPTFVLRSTRRTLKKTMKCTLKTLRLPLVGNLTPNSNSNSNNNNNNNNNNT